LDKNINKTKAMKKYPKPNWSFHFYKYWNFRLIPHYMHTKLWWKDKYNSPRCERVPHYRFEWLWFGINIEQGDDQSWEQWIWVHKYCDGDIEKARETWGWVSGKTKQSTWK